ncbi:MAG: peptidylprolyl isomerase [Bdellovibrionia bacterium]
MNIQKSIGSVFVHAVVGFACYATTQVAFSKELANVNGHVITDQDLTLALGALNDRQRDDFLKDSISRQFIVQGLIDQDVLVREAEKLKLDQEPEVKNAVNVFKKQLIVNRLLDKKLANQLTPTALEKYFNLHKDIYSTSQVHVQQILVSDESEAKRLKKLAEEKPGGFQELAEKYSKDPAAKTTRGDLGFVSHDRLVREFTDAAFATPDGKIAGPIKTIYGYHVIKVIQKRAGKPLEYSEVELRVRDALRAELIRDYTDKLRAQATIKVDEGAVEKP